MTLALQCGGSDGYSGITANPALGAAVDELVRHGGTAILSETPEIYGAEHLLTRRAVNRAVGEKLVERIKWWEAYCERNGGEMNNNPSPGNKAGGLTTILEKSLGAAAKGGTTTMRAVYEYAEPVKEKGFVFMDTPGYDPVGATGQVAGGANVMCFTTGRGSAFGCKPTPSIKLATNHTSTRSMIDDMDINCGDILDGVPVDAEGQGDLRKVLERRVGRADQVARSSATATTSSCRGRSARRCSVQPERKLHLHRLRPIRRECERVVRVRQRHGGGDSGITSTNPPPISATASANSEWKRNVPRSSISFATTTFIGRFMPWPAMPICTTMPIGRSAASAPASAFSLPEASNTTSKWPLSAS